MKVKEVIFLLAGSLWGIVAISTRGGGVDLHQRGRGQKEMRMLQQQQNKGDVESTDVSVVCDLDCEATRGPGSTCLQDEDNDGAFYCSNPFAGGCLRRKLGEKRFPVPRTCNSDDDGNDKKNKDDCTPSRHDYTEIRISPANWESAMFLAWIQQILLSELVDVPVTIETGVGRSGERPLSFYDAKSSFKYPKTANNFEALYKSNEMNGDCTRTTESCANLIPELWQANRVVDESQLERDGNGMIGHVAWYIPPYLARRDPSLTTHWGLRSELNRFKLARTFKRPTKWGDYCREVSPTNCTADGETGAATRPPQDEKEEGRYHAEGHYIGHFRATEKNDCTDGKKCTGHLIDYPCTWSAYTESQLYWNGIPLESDAPGGSYSYGEILQIFAASNATQEAAIFVWYYPDPNTDLYELQEVSLPKATSQCLANRPDPVGGRCGANFSELVGETDIGSCGYNTHYLEKVFAKGLRERSFDSDEASRSPGYQTLRNIRVSDIDISEMMLAWVKRGVDKYGYDPREAVCEWVVNNLNEGKNLTRFVPVGYPRVYEDQDYSIPILYAAMAIAGIVLVLVMVTARATRNNRTRKVIKWAQPIFLYLFCLGFFLVCCGALVQAAPPSMATCISTEWFALIGNTLGLVPLIIKIAAINKIHSSSKKMKRVVIKQERLFQLVGLAVFFVTVYLVLWTAIDTPTRVDHPVLTSEEGVVEIQYDCGSSNDGWKLAVFAFEAALVLSAAILAYQSRGVRQEFRESLAVANMAYARFLFLLFRIMVYLLPPDVLAWPINAGITSLLYSFDSLAALSLYFGPKFWAIITRDKNASQKVVSTHLVRKRPPTDGTQDSNKSIQQAGGTEPRRPPRQAPGTESWRVAPKQRSLAAVASASSNVRFLVDDDDDNDDDSFDSISECSAVEFIDVEEEEVQYECDAADTSSSAAAQAELETSLHGGLASSQQGSKTSSIGQSGSVEAVVDPLDDSAKVVIPEGKGQEVVNVADLSGAAGALEGEMSRPMPPAMSLSVAQRPENTNPLVGGNLDYDSARGATREDQHCRGSERLAI